MALFIYRNHVTLWIDHKPLEWFVTILDVYGRRGRWINTLQDFCFKIIHHVGSKHMNVDALSHNPINFVEENKDLRNDIQDCKLLQ